MTHSQRYTTEITEIQESGVERQPRLRNKRIGQRMLWRREQIGLLGWRQKDTHSEMNKRDNRSRKK